MDDQVARRAPPPADPRYAESRRITAKFGEVSTGAALEELSAADRAREAPATHRLTCVWPRLEIEAGMVFDADNRAWRVVSVSDPYVARHVEIHGAKARTVENLDARKFLAILVEEVRRGRSA